MSMKLTDVQRTALGDCVAYLLERLRQQKIASESPNAQLTSSVVSAEQAQSGTQEVPTTQPAQIDIDQGAVA